jgi:hypothetical protein
MTIVVAQDFPTSESPASQEALVVSSQSVQMHSPGPGLRFWTPWLVSTELPWMYDVGHGESRHQRLKGGLFLYCLPRRPLLMLF